MSKKRLSAKHFDKLRGLEEEVNRLHLVVSHFDCAIAKYHVSDNTMKEFLNYRKRKEFCEMSLARMWDKMPSCMLRYAFEDAADRHPDLTSRVRTILAEILAKREQKELEEVAVEVKQKQQKRRI
jgi:hypothetical protein